jgi:hypothetical protein
VREHIESRLSGDDSYLDFFTKDDLSKDWLELTRASYLMTCCFHFTLQLYPNIIAYGQNFPKLSHLLKPTKNEMKRALESKALWYFNE